MEIIRENEDVRFNFYQMQEQITKYGDRKIESVEEIQEAIQEVPPFTVVGYITEEKGKEWKIQNYVVGITYIVSWVGNNYCYCLPGGTIF